MKKTTTPTNNTDYIAILNNAVNNTYLRFRHPLTNAIHIFEKTVDVQSLIDKGWKAAA